MRGINLDLVAPFRAHLSQSHLRVLKKHRVLDVTKAYRDTRGICHGVRSDLEDIRREGSGRGAKDELEGVVRIKL